MDYVVICAVSLIVSGLTLFSGFGLGTLLMPAFALFFPVTVAVAATAVVHLLNNVFKTFLVGRHADWKVVLQFALPAAAAAFLGAWLLSQVAGVPAFVEYKFAGQSHAITPVNLTIGALIIVFSMFELLPTLREIGFNRKFLTPGGLLSGFFGGLSGHQGALRSAFLVKIGLGKQAYIGTSVVASVIVDVSRLIVYGFMMSDGPVRGLSRDSIGLVSAACVAAFVGAFAGARLMPKVELKSVEILVGILLLLSGGALMAGLV